MKQPVFLKIIKPTPANSTGGKKKNVLEGYQVSQEISGNQMLALDTGTWGAVKVHERFRQGGAGATSSLVTICSRLNPTQTSQMTSDYLWPCCHSLKIQSLGTGLWLAERWSNVHRQVQGLQRGLICSSPASRAGSHILTSIHLGFTKIERVFGCWTTKNDKCLLHSFLS